MGVALGVGWALVTGAIIADSYDVALGENESDTQATVGGTGDSGRRRGRLMLVPAVVMRLWRPGTRESLDGFVIGALGAIGFTAAATLTRLAPQFATGVTIDDRPASVLLVQAGIQAIALPLTAAAMGGLVGAALWFGRPVVHRVQCALWRLVFSRIGPRRGHSAAAGPALRASRVGRGIRPARR